MASAQEPVSADYELYHKMYSNDNAVYLKNEENNVITFDNNNQLKITRDNNQEILLIGNSINEYSERTVGYSGFNELISLDAKTLVPVKNNYKSIPVSNVIAEKSTDDYIFYDDSWDKRVY
jgi:hypothetical protein